MREIGREHEILIRAHQIDQLGQVACLEWLFDRLCTELDMLACILRGFALQPRELGAEFAPVLVKPPEQTREPAEAVLQHCDLSLIHISEPTRRTPISYAV